MRGEKEKDTDVEEEKEKGIKKKEKESKYTLSLLKDRVTDSLNDVISDRPVLYQLETYRPKSLVVVYVCTTFRKTVRSS